MDIQLPIQSLKELLQKETQTDLRDFDVWLQNGQVLEPELSLVNYCEPGYSLVQVNAEIFRGDRRINIADVLKSTKEISKVIESVEESIGMDADVIMSEQDQDNSSGTADRK